MGKANSSKGKGSEGYFYIAIFIFSGIGLMQMLLAHQVYDHVQSMPIGDQSPKLSDALIVIASGAFFVLYEYINKWLTLDFIRKLVKGETPELRDFYAKKACFNSYKMQYFAFATVWGYRVLKPSGWLNWELGGDISIAEMTKLLLGTMPYMPIPRDLQIYALVTMGFHTGDWFAMVFIREATSDYYEMTLHHIATFTCYYTALLTNASLGFVGFFLHDIADIFTTMGRMLSSTNFEGASLACGICLITTWIWTRLYILPHYLVAMWTVPVQEGVAYLQWMNCFQTMVLQVMHIYWFYLIVGMILHKLKGGKLEDTQSSPVDKPT